MRGRHQAMGGRLHRLRTLGKVSERVFQGNSSPQNTHLGSANELLGVNHTDIDVIVLVLRSLLDKEPVQSST